MTFAPIDIVFLIVILFFALTALSKGFVKELFSKVSITGGLAAAIFFAPKLDIYVSQTINNSIVSIVLSFALIFIVVFLTISIIQHFVAKVFEGEIMKGLDRSLGFILGIAEGIVCCIFIISLLKTQRFFNCSELIENSLFCRIFGNFFVIPNDYFKGFAA